MIVVILVFWFLLHKLPFPFINDKKRNKCDVEIDLL